MARQVSIPFFTSVTLLICIGIFGLRSLVANGSNEEELLRSRLKLAQKEVSEARFRALLAKVESEELKTDVALLLPKEIHGPGRRQDATTYEERSIASVLNQPQDSLQIERASSLLAKAKEEFRGRSFDKANNRLERLLKLYPDSVHGPEARFLLVEGQFQNRDYEACIAVIEEMIRLYPESELTGFALLRLARIYEIRDRLEDAAEIYRSVAKNFSQDELKKQALHSLKAVDL